MGTAIVDALKTGLSLIGDLAEAFLDGFTTLFWDATLNSGAGGLTVFGNYSLIMLSVAIVFSIISLCFGVLRSNAGV